VSELLDFKISSGLKDIIGKELITNDRIAIFELVKNSYDANARKVKIVFQNIKEGGKNKPSKILILDDGDGMSETDLKKKWLFVGFSDKKYSEQDIKKDYRHRIKKKRFFAGAKGVGRFSCDRLGSKLEIYTKKEDESKIHHLEVDWTKFEEDQKKEFQTIKVKYSLLNKVDIDDCPVKNFKKGTILEISSLDDNWDKVKLLDLRKYLQRLVNPSIDDEAQEFEIDLQAREYIEEDKKIKKGQEYNLINGVIKNVVFEKLDIKTTQIKSSISNGKIKTELVDKGKFIFRLEEKNEYPDLDGVTVNLFYLSQAAKYSFTSIMGIEPKNYGSIFLYKNKFRIHPYGDEGDDWLGLEKRKAQGYSRYLANRELMGRIELHGSQPYFKEVSSRAGGVNVTEAYKHLLEYFIEKILRRLERYVVEGIDWDKEGIEKQKAPEQIKRDSLELIQKLAGQIKDPEKNIQFSPDLLTVLKDKQIENLPQVIKNVETLKKYVKAPEEKAYIDKQLNSVRIATRNLELEKYEKEKELKAKERESLFLTKVVSADKEIVTNLNHTIENSTLTIKEMIIGINKKINENCPIKEIIPFVDKLNVENEKIKVVSEIVSLANFDTKINVIKADLVVYIKEYLERIVKAEILNFNFINDTTEYSTNFKPIEISIMLDNLVSNAKKAGANSMSVRFKDINKKLVVQFADNGKGIDSKITPKIFERGFTTTRGSGVGLHYVKTMIEKMGGDVKYLGNGVDNLGKGACFEVTFP
jgi:hypothetical protein